MKALPFRPFDKAHDFQPFDATHDFQPFDGGHDLQQAQGPELAEGQPTHVNKETWAGA